MPCHFWMNRRVEACVCIMLHTCVFDVQVPTVITHHQACNHGTVQQHSWQTQPGPEWQSSSCSVPCSLCSRMASCDSGCVVLRITSSSLNRTVRFSDCGMLSWTDRIPKEPTAVAQSYMHLHLHPLHRHDSDLLTRLSDCIRCRLMQFCILTDKQCVVTCTSIPDLMGNGYQY